MDKDILRQVIDHVLRDHDALCLDNERERRQLTEVLVEVIGAIGFDELVRKGS